MKFTAILPRSSGNQIDANCRASQNSEVPKYQRQKTQRPEEFKEVQRFYGGSCKSASSETITSPFENS